MRLQVFGLTRLDIFLFRFLFCWILLLTGVQVGLWKGRKVERNSWETALAEVSQEYEVLHTLERIIIAESSGRTNIWGQDGEFGICQFKKSTFYFLAEKVGLPNPNWKDQSQQMYLLRWALENGYGNHWVTYRKAKEQ